MYIHTHIYLCVCKSKQSNKSWKCFLPLPYDPTILFLVVHSREMRMHIYTQIYVYKCSWGYWKPNVWILDVKYKESCMQKNWCFWPVNILCWRRRWRSLLRVPWTTRGSEQPILKELIPEYLLGRLILKLKLQYFDHLMQRADSLGKTLGKAGKDGRWEEMGMPDDEMIGWHH